MPEAMLSIFGVVAQTAIIGTFVVFRVRTAAGKEDQRRCQADAKNDDAPNEMGVIFHVILGRRYLF